MACSNLRHGKERKGRSVILEREIFNLQNKNPCGIPLYGGMRGSIRNLKAVEKIIHNCKPAKPPKKKTRSETCCKPTLVTRYFSGTVSDVTQSNYSSTTNIDA